MFHTTRYLGISQLYNKHLLVVNITFHNKLDVTIKLFQYVKHAKDLAKSFLETPCTHIDLFVLYADR